MNPLRAALVPTLLLVTALAVAPSAQAYPGTPEALVVTSPITGDGSFVGIQCATAILGVAVITGVVMYGAVQTRIGDAFYDDIGTAPSPYGATGGLFMDGTKLEDPFTGNVPSYSLAHVYVVNVGAGTHCFTFEDSNYNDNLGVISITLL